MTRKSAEHYYLQTQMKSVGMAYLMWGFFGAHYAYQRRWGTQILYWITIGGFFIWAFIDLFRIPGMIDDHNWEVAQEMEALDEREARRALR